MRISKGPSEAYVRSRVPRGFHLDVARSIQRMLASKVVERDTVPINDIDLITGIDVAYIEREDNEIGISIASTYSLTSRSIVEWSCWVGNIVFPYVPTLLSFRELKPVVNAYLRLRRKPHVVLIDGHGKAHPFRLGIASHFGVCMNVPTIGVAKSLLYGKASNDEGPILDPNTNEIIGWVIRCAPSKPTYISVGHGITLDTAINLVRRLCAGSQMPIPILHSHNRANELKRRIIKNLSKGITNLDSQCTSILM
ncbi:MAG: endonuclease V [Vulcanisaeta sp.]